jgi:cell division protease FtsH
VNQQFYRNMALWVVILVMILLLVTMLRQGQQAPLELAYSEFERKVEAGDVQSVLIEENHIEVHLADGEVRNTFAPVLSGELIERLRGRGVEITARQKPEAGFWRQMLIMWFPMILIIGLWVVFIRQMQAGGGKAMSFGKSRARLLTENQQRVTFEDVAGVDDWKFEV